MRIPNNLVNMFKQLTSFCGIIGKKNRLEKTSMHFSLSIHYLQSSSNSLKSSDIEEYAQLGDK